jgi:hypothetical protein
MQRYELDAWLGDDHGLTGQQVKDLLDIATTIESRYPDPDDVEERANALTAACRAMAEDDLYGLIREYGERLAAARRAEQTALSSLRQLAGYGIPEAAFARVAGVDRMTVRNWLGKR